MNKKFVYQVRNNKKVSLLVFFKTPWWWSWVWPERVGD